jgi:hypothetical protein
MPSWRSTRKNSESDLIPVASKVGGMRKLKKKLEEREVSEKRSMTRKQVERNTTKFFTSNKTWL